MSFIDDLLSQVSTFVNPPALGGLSTNNPPDPNNMNGNESATILALTNLLSSAGDQRVQSIPSPIQQKPITQNKQPTQPQMQPQDSAMILALTNLINASSQGVPSAPVSTSKGGVQVSNTPPQPVTAPAVASSTLDTPVDTPKVIPVVPLTEAEKRVAYINEQSAAGNYGNTGNQIRAIIQPNGRTLLTNVGTPSTGKVQQQGGVNGAAMTSTLMKEQLDAIYNEPDEKKRIDLYTNLQSSFAQHNVQLSNEVLAKAEASVDLPSLKAKLAVQRHQDVFDRQRDPSLAGKSNPATDLMERQVANATAEASHLADRAIKSNVELAGMTEQLKVAGPMINKADAMSAARDIKQTALEAKQQLAIDKVVAATPEVAYSNIEAVFPEMKGKTKEEQAVFLSSKSSLNATPEMKAKYNAVVLDPSTAVKHAFVNSSSPAIDVARFHEMKATGKSISEVDASLNDVKTLMNNSADFNKAVSTFFKGDKVTQDRLTIIGNTASKGSDASKLEGKAARFDAVREILTAKRTSEFSADVSKWDNYDISSPMGKAIADLKVLKLDATVDNVVKQLVGTDATPTVRIQAKKYFHDEAVKAAERANTSFISKVDLNSTLMRAQGALASKSSFGSKVETAAENFKGNAKDLGGIITQLTPEQRAANRATATPPSSAEQWNNMFGTPPMPIEETNALLGL